MSHQNLLLRPRHFTLVALAALMASCGPGADGPEGAAESDAGIASERGPVDGSDSLMAAEPLDAVEPVSAPAAPGSGEPSLAPGASDALLSWIEPAGEGHALRFARWTGAGWGEPRTIVERDDMFVNWADFPAMAELQDGTLIAHWLQKSGPATYAYDVRMAVSRDGGATWSEDIIPHRDGIQAEHGFVSLLPMGDRLGLAWLDGRETVTGEPMTVRFATLSPSGQVGERVLLDGSTCDCCQTDAALATDGPIVAYRDRTEGEIRDISVVRRVDGAWSDPVTVHEDGWRIEGCPVNGPGVAADGERVAVAWFTAAPPAVDRSDADQADSATAAGDGHGAAGGDAPARVLVAFSSDGGASFGEPVRIDGGSPVGRVDLVMLDGGDALVSWVERTDDGAEIRLRRASARGAGAPRSVVTTDAARASGFPRMVRDGEQLLLAWTQPGAPSQVRTARVPLSSLPRP